MSFGIASKLGLVSLVRCLQRTRSSIETKLKVERLKMSVNRRGSAKVFVIGFNKTGTTTLKMAIGELDYIVGNQQAAELLFDRVVAGDYKDLIEYCKTAEAFQDIPFSLPEVYKYLDNAFPGSKFILTVRESDEVWFESLVRYHARKFGSGRPATAEDLKRAKYIYPGYIYNVMITRFGRKLYDKEAYTAAYNAHNHDVRSYFNNRPDDFLELQVTEPEAYQTMCAFLGVPPVRDVFPWENRTDEIQVE